MSYGANPTDVYRQAGIYPGRILKRAWPADFPAPQPTNFDPDISIGIARALVLTIPQALRLSEDEVIQ